MKVSIIVPVYNTEKYLARCLSSLVGQTYRNTEIVIIDDGSTDKSLKIAESYAKDDGRVKVLTKKHTGANLARKKGIENATGDYFMFIDSDDWIEHDTIEKLTQILRRKRYDIIKFNAVNEPSGKNVPGLDLKGEKEREFAPGDIKRLALETKLLRSLAYEIISEEVVKAAKSFGRAMSYGEDYLANLEIIDNASSFLAVDDVFYHYRKDTCSSTTTSRDKAIAIRNFEDTEKVCESMIKYAKKWGVENSNHAAFIVLDTYRNSIYHLLEVGQVTEDEFCSLIGSISSTLEKIRARTSLPELFKVLLRRPLSYQVKHSAEIIYVFNGDYDRLWARKRFYRTGDGSINKYMHGRLGNQLFQYAGVRQIQ